YEGRDCWLIWLAVDPVVDDLRSDKRFGDLLGRLGLATSHERLLGVRRLDAALVSMTQDRPKRRQAAALQRGALAILALALIAVGYVLVKYFTRNKAASGPAVINFAQVTYESGPEFFPSLSPDGNSVAYASRAS